LIFFYNKSSQVLTLECFILVRGIILALELKTHVFSPFWAIQKKRLFETHRLTLWSYREERQKIPPKERRRRIGDNASERRGRRREKRRSYSIKPIFAAEFQAQTCHSRPAFQATSMYDRYLSFYYRYLYVTICMCQFEIFW